MINKIKALLGLKEIWHVSFIVSCKSYGDGTYTFRPKLTPHLIDSLRNELACEATLAVGSKIAPSKINIIGMTKL